MAASTSSCVMVGGVVVMVVQSLTLCPFWPHLKHEPIRLRQFANKWLNPPQKSQRFFCFFPCLCYVGGGARFVLFKPALFLNFSLSSSGSCSHWPMTTCGGGAWFCFCEISTAYASTCAYRVARSVRGRPWWSSPLLADELLPWLLVITERGENGSISANTSSITSTIQVNTRHHLTSYIYIYINIKQ